LDNKLGTKKEQHEAGSKPRLIGKKNIPNANVRNVVVMKLPVSDMIHGLFFFLLCPYSPLLGLGRFSVS
jgi:hypothetical protein